MIITVTPNPAWDVTYEVPGLTPGEVHRVGRVHRRLGGKGVNAARVLAALGHPAVALLPGPDDLVGPHDLASTAESADGAPGKVALFDRARTGGYGPGGTGVVPPGSGVSPREAAAALRLDVVPGLPVIRQTLVVQAADGTTTSLWEPGHQAAPETGDLLLARVLGWLRPGPGADPAQAAGTGLAVSGSLPPGLDPALPARLAAAALEAGVPALVDASGPALAHAARVPGIVLTPNAAELAQLTGAPCDDATAAVAAARMVVAEGPDVVLATLGAKGMVAVTRAGTWRGVLPEPLPGNPTGAGDAAAAVVIAGLARRAPWPEIILDAVAASAAAVLSPVAGEVSLADYAALRPKVNVSEVP